VRHPGADTSSPEKRQRHAHDLVALTQGAPGPGHTRAGEHGGDRPPIPREG
jgi:hypothetical protein